MTSAPASHAPPAAPPKNTARTTELLLLLFAAVVVTGALFIVQSAQGEPPSWNIAKYTAAFIVVYGLAHAAIRRFAPHADPLLLPLVSALNGLGLVMIYRIDMVPPTSGQADQQMIWTLIGVAVFAGVLIVVRDHRTLSRYAYTLGIGGLIFLVIPAVLPASLSERGGSMNWIAFGPFSVQPSEFSKILIIIFTASFLVSRRDLFTTAGKHFAGMDFPRIRDLGPLLGAWAVAIAVLGFESDLGTSLLIFATALAMLYIATERVSWVAIGLTLFVAGAVLAYQLFPHFQQRVRLWIDPFSQESYDFSNQLAQSLFGLATGGVFGTGFGSGHPTQVGLAESDFILASFGEELGLVGLAAITILYLIFAVRGLRIAVSVRDSFGKLLAAGLSFTVIIQVFVVYGGISKLIPLTGLTTPFLAYGGSSLLANYILLAILIRVSDAARRPDAPKRKPKAVDSMATRVVPTQ
ncbi:FtsW/RodA/SpoVE family cell cycle protein [Gordonia shandongensis]|uniref:FtsW/RodA/SpoVE family cell cycle protein n=1 Tax=Gordonia shandongensis TaxID=376351 RepID=UPI00041BF9CB|nr:FtsW/RodA/SpoVE family cell cycle protein [Gordonia shandongensis]